MKLVVIIRQKVPIAIQAQPAPPSGSLAVCFIGDSGLLAFKLLATSGLINVSVTKREAQVQPDRVLNIRRREPMAAIRDHGHAEILSDTPPTPDPRFRDNAVRTTTPERFCTGSSLLCLRRIALLRWHGNSKSASMAVSGYILIQ